MSEPFTMPEEAVRVHDLRAVAYPSEQQFLEGLIRRARGALSDETIDLDDHVDDPPRRRQRRQQRRSAPAVPVDDAQVREHVQRAERPLTAAEIAAALGLKGQQLGPVLRKLRERREIDSTIVNEQRVYARGELLSGSA